MLSGLENPTHWLLVAIIAMIVLGPKRLPEFGRSLGSGLRDFREALSGTHDRPHGDTASRPRSGDAADTRDETDA